mmetsp:Transcript_43338/g.123566  ORF Transcript_43338/g.123566 Transcript_43338/m.123566 type:complete len:371 (+) Transcript_43338:488-1600(+)
MRGTSAKSLSAQAKGTYRKYSHYFPRCLYDGVPQVSSDRADEVEGGVSDVLSNFAEHDESENSPPDFLIFEDVEAAYKEKQSCDWEEFVRNRDTVVIADAYLRILQQALEALVFLQDTGFIHHNLHEDNVALRIYYLEEFDHWKPVVRVSEFGNMIEASEDYLCVDAATNSNHPPEYNQQSGNCGMFDPKHPFAYDLYMMGGYLMHILTGYSWTDSTFYPLKGLNAEQLQKVFSPSPKFLKEWDDYRQICHQQRKEYNCVTLRLLWSKIVCTSLEDGSQTTMPVHQLAQLVKYLGHYNKDDLPNEYTKVWTEIDNMGQIQKNDDLSRFPFKLLNVITAMLTYEPGQRGTAKDLLVQTNHLRQELLRGLRK